MADIKHRCLSTDNLPCHAELDANDSDNTTAPRTECLGLLPPREVLATGGQAGKGKGEVNMPGGAVRVDWKPAGAGNNILVNNRGSEASILGDGIICREQGLDVPGV